MRYAGGVVSGQSSPGGAGLEVPLGQLLLSEGGHLQAPPHHQVLSLPPRLVQPHQQVPLRHIRTTAASTPSRCAGLLPPGGSCMPHQPPATPPVGGLTLPRISGACADAVAACAPEGSPP